MAYSGSVNYYLNVSLQDCVIDDQITIEFNMLNYGGLSHPWTGSISQGSLNIAMSPLLYGALPFATSSNTFGNFISGTLAPNVLILNRSVSAFFGSYVQDPSFESGSTGNTYLVTSSLFEKYGEINYTFEPTIADKVVIRGKDGRTQIATISKVDNTNIDKKVRLYVRPDLDQYFILDVNNISQFLIVKKVKDEQNIILEFNKTPGQTSYGFLIPDNITDNLLKNISVVQSNVQNQLLSTQQNSL